MLWVLILAVWTFIVSLRSRSIPEIMSAQVLAVLGMISVGFLLFTLFTSNPFARLFPIPVEGRDLNPLLQDIGLAIHPPMLYLGYVGFSVPFAFAVATLISGRFDAAWIKWSRPWTNVAWMFLTIGIALGSWWAYYELGWGGWWFWDPVENASFMPWLIGTALIHSLAATEKRGVFKAWTVLLAVFAFSLSLLGTFLVRSGVLISVHAFASDPKRGLFILLFLSIVIGSSLLLFAWRASNIKSRVRFELISREMSLLLNNVLFGVLCFAVLLGTLYPLIIDSLGMGKISVGPPYFDFIFLVVGLPLVIVMSIGALIRWKKDRLVRLQKGVTITLLCSVLFAVLTPLLMPYYSLGAALGLFAGGLVIALSVQPLYQRVKTGNTWNRLCNTPKGIYGMVVAHIGIGIFIIGVTMTNVYSVERDVRLSKGESYSIHDFDFSFNGVRMVQGPNYQAVRGDFDVSESQSPLTTLHPEKRTYLVQQNPMTEAAIDPGLMRDLYVALGEPLEDNQSWAVRIYYKPLIRWIWLGTIFMAVGGLLGAMDRRYLKTARLSHLNAETIAAKSA